MTESAPKRKSIFTDVIHLAGLAEANVQDGYPDKASRDTVLDLRVKPAHIFTQQNRHHHQQSFYPTVMPSFLEHGPAFIPLFSQPSSSAFFPSEPFVSYGHFYDVLPHGLNAINTNNWAFVNAFDARCLQHPSLSRETAGAHTLPAPSRALSYAVEGDVQNVCSQKAPNSKMTIMAPMVAGGAINKQAPRFQCPDCNRIYSTFSGLSKHRQFHCASQLKKQFGCKFCQKQYTSLGALKMHIRTHTLPCKCDICGKAFSRPWLLQGHVRTHTGEKPFRCLHCGRAFADRSNLRAHLQTHSEVKKYRCASCQKTFSRMSLLTKHENNGCASSVSNST